MKEVSLLIKRNFSLECLEVLKKCDSKKMKALLNALQDTEYFNEKYISFDSLSHNYEILTENEEIYKILRVFKSELIEELDVEQFKIKYAKELNTIAENYKMQLKKLDMLKTKTNIEKFIPYLILLIFVMSQFFYLKITGQI